MLENLDKVDWASLHHAYGSAEDVPEMIRAIIEENLDEDEELAQELREEAYDSLANSINHQGDLYTATVATIPFLIELLEEDIPDKFNLVGMLIDILHSVSYFRVGNVEKGVLPVSALALNIDAYKAVAAGMDIYQRLLRQKNADLRRQVVLLLGLLREPYDIISDELIRIIREDTEVENRANAAFEMGILLVSKYVWKRPADHIQLLETLLKTDQERLVRVAAAIALTRHYGDVSWQRQHIPSELSHVLMDAFLQPLNTKSIERYGEDQIIEAMVRLGHKYYLEPLLKLLETPELNTDKAHSVSRELLDLVFIRQARSIGFVDDLREIEMHRWLYFQPNWIWKPESKERYYTFPQVHDANLFGYYQLGRPLKEGQKTVLRAIVTNDAFWQLPTNVFSFFYGLPDSREELRALIEKS